MENMCSVPPPCPEQDCCTKLKYMQPPRAKSCKPPVCYRPPSIQMEIDTIYKNSYLGADVSFRAQPALPQNNIKASTAKMDTKTTLSLSFPGHFCIPVQKPIRPCPPSLLGEGPMQDLTTQKHDYVCKPFCRRCPLKPPTCLGTPNCPLEKETTFRLSFMTPPMEKTISCKPIVCYKPPALRMETDTTQKLSFMPVCLPVKENHSWANRSKYKLPNIPMEMQTIQKLSYPAPGCYIEDPNFCCPPTVNDNYPRAAIC